MNSSALKIPAILIVDDEVDMRQIMNITLQSKGWKVEQAANGANALKKIHESKPDLIVIDLMMPGMSGTEFCNRLINDLKLEDMPVLLISAASEKSSVVMDFINLPLKFKDFLKKPFQSDDLIRNVESVLQRSGFKTATTAPTAAATTPTAPVSSPSPLSPPASSSFGKFDTPVNKGYRVLIIDDESDIREILKTALGMYHTCETAENGMVGLKKLEEFAPDFIMSDINMPVMNGLETAAAIRWHPHLSHVPIFFLTGETDKNMPKKAYDIGANLYLRKPVNPIQLIKFTDHFITETKLEAGGNLKLMQKAANAAPAPAASQAAKPAPSPATPAPPAVKVRVLFVESDPSKLDLLRRIVEEGPGGIKEAGETELLWANDTRDVIGNLCRWEPDIIFYDTNNQGYDGIAFSQMLKLNKEFSKLDMAFMGVEFTQADTKYSRDNFRRDTINLTHPDSQIGRQIAQLITIVHGNTRPKKFTIDRIYAEEDQRRKEVSDLQTKENLQRQSFTRRYKDLQKYIDTNM